MHLEQSRAEPSYSSCEDFQVATLKSLHDYAADESKLKENERYCKLTKLKRCKENAQDIQIIINSVFLNSISAEWRDLE